MKAHIKQQSHFMPTPDRDQSIFRPSSIVSVLIYSRSERTSCTARTALERFLSEAVQLLGMSHRSFSGAGREEGCAPGREGARFALGFRRQSDASGATQNR